MLIPLHNYIPANAGDGDGNSHHCTPLVIYIERKVIQGVISLYLVINAAVDPLFDSSLSVLLQILNTECTSKYTH